MALGVGELCGFTIRVDGATREIASRVAEVEATNFVAVTAGPWDVIGTVNAASDEAVLDVLDELRAIQGVGALDAYAHLAVSKEQYQRLGMPEVLRGS
jgi:hypothetical protein